MAAVIEVEKLTKTYREGWVRRRQLEVLKGLTLSVGEGEVFGLLGPNGAGKTTFIKILLGIVRPSGGQANLLGHRAGSRASRHRVGYLPENLRIPRYHTANTALEYYGQLSGVSLSTIRKRGPELLQLVGLANRSRDSISKYSKGMLQRLGLAQALLHDPQLVILDEPTDGLDPVGRSQIRQVLTHLKQQGKTVFLNSHILQEVELVCDRVAILDKGELRFVGPVGDATTTLGQTGEQGGAVAFEVQFELVGDEARVRQAFGEAKPHYWDRMPDGLIRVRLRLDDQAAVDQHVDQIRRAGISVVGMARRRATLEDAFLAIVEPVHDAEVIGE